MKVYLDTVGCRLNQSEIETFARQFRAADHRLVSDPSEADLVVVNTCAVTSAAAADSRKMIRHAARFGPENVVVTGCWATLHPEEAALLPGVTQVFANPQKDLLVPGVLKRSAEILDLEPVARTPVPGARLRTRAFIKVQDGCDNRCTFCVTTIARGPGRSRGVSEVLTDVNAAVLWGTQEIVLTGVHLGSWGYDLAAKGHLRDLVKVILNQTDVPRVRLSSLEPWDLEAEFFALWDDPRLCRHLHLPLQSGCNATLRRMARKTTRESFSELVRSAREAQPEIAITTDIIVGFPGEDEEEFRESLDFVRRMDFAGGHVFTFSARDGTAAARMPEQVPHRVRKERNALMRAAVQESALRYRRQFIGDVFEVLWESTTVAAPHRWTLKGLTDNFLRVTTEAPREIWNQITPVRLTGINPTGLSGQLEDGNRTGGSVVGE